MSTRPAPMNALAISSASQLAAAIARREIGCLEALEIYIERVERIDRKLNAIVVRDFDRARVRARDLDSLQGTHGPLHGVPITVKESFDVAGLPTTFGIAEFANNVVSRNAVAVQRLEAAGAVVFGKTNVPQLLLDWQSFNAIYGVSKNPWELAHTPGGSSGGAAAAIAAGLSALEVGSDIGGSIRVPAHFTGIFGHKPTYGLLPMIGHSLAGAITPADISAIGPLARSVADLELTLGLLTGADPADSNLRLTLPPARAESMTEMRVAIWADDDASPTDPEITAQIHELADFLARRGAHVRVARPPIDAAESYDLFLRLLGAAISPRFGKQQLAEAQVRVAADPSNPEPDSVLDRSFAMSHREWLMLSERRHVLRRIWQAFFDDYDVLLCPPFGTPALPHDTTTVQRERRVTVNGRTIPYNGLGFWPGIVGVCHLPATVVPLGLTQEGLPIGVQIVGALHGDLQTLAFARLLEQEWRAYVAPPGVA